VYDLEVNRRLRGALALALVGTLVAGCEREYVLPESRFGEIEKVDTRERRTVGVVAERENGGTVVLRADGIAQHSFGRPRRANERRVRVWNSVFLGGMITLLIGVAGIGGGIAAEASVANQSAMSVMIDPATAHAVLGGGLATFVAGLVLTITGAAIYPYEVRENQVVRVIR
jgi:hypothetical protein